MPSKVTGKLTGGGLTTSPLLVGPLVNAARASLYFQPAHIAHQLFADVAAVDDNGYVIAKTSTALPAAAGTVTFTPDGAIVNGTPDMPRNVVVTVTHGSAVVAASGVITGYDEYGQLITEAWSVTAGTTSKVFTGVVAFQRVVSVTYVTAADATTNTLIVGTGKVLGFSFPCACPSLVKELSGGSLVTNGVTVAASTAANTDARGTYTPNGTPNGSLDFEVWYLVNNPGASA